MSDISLQRPRTISAAGRYFAVEIARHPRARRYVLRMTPNGTLRLTVPRRATIAGGLAFAARQRDWILREWSRLERRAAAWVDGTEIWYRGGRVRLSVRDGAVCFGGESAPTGDDADLRPAVERRLRDIAGTVLPDRLGRLAQERGLPSGTVKVRNQRSRWGSCSTRGSIALNWRLIQMPDDVSDYIILHEIAHRRHGNHSARFWREVDALCPWWKSAEKWLRQYGSELL
jgi:predicted metal-dependent hydrolase